MTMWGGNFEKPPADEARAFTRSFPWDRRMFREDIVASMAHAEMLGMTKIIPERDAGALVQALDRLLDELLASDGPPDEGDEDIFSFVERRLTVELGDPGRRLHTARSRNDQVATDLRLYVKALSLRLASATLGVVQVLVDRARRETETIAPGFTHLQSAQPVSLGHYLLGLAEMLGRDVTGFIEAFSKADQSPLGSGALAGVPYPIDRAWVATRLAFGGMTRNSMDAVADRDYVLSIMNACCMLMVHLSRWCEDLVIWSSPAFAMVQFDDAFSTGSSMMPQKKNPDVAELVRGKAGTVLGLATGLMITLKGVPLTYGLDLQEDKQAVFRVEDEVGAVLRVVRGAAGSLVFNRTRMREVAALGHPTATDLADYLVEKGLPFRTAHEIASRAVRTAHDKGVTLEGLSDADLGALDRRLEPDVRTVLTLEGSVGRRVSAGGTAPTRVQAAVTDADGWIDLQRGRIRELEARGLPTRLLQAWGGAHGETT